MQKASEKSLVPFVDDANEMSIVPFVADDDSDFEMEDVDDSSYDDNEVVALQPNQGVQVESIVPSTTKTKLKLMMWLNSRPCLTPISLTWTWTMLIDVTSKLLEMWRLCERGR
jgi:hypothetical protein